jgi:protein-S-isoprenylcysteine O-methyltransferase Ste14
MILFGAMHSVVAGKPVKDWVKSRVGTRVYEGLYRVTYNVLAVITLLPFAIPLLFFPGAIVWQVYDFPALIFRILQIVGLIGLTISLIQIDLGQFSGISQFRAYLANEFLPLPAEPLQTGGAYRLFRHPLYVFSVLVIWFQPTMTEALLAFNTGATAYFLLGSRLEEQRLIATFGEEYRTYRNRVGWLFPRFWRKTEQHSNKFSVEQTSQLR